VEYSSSQQAILDHIIDIEATGVPGLTLALNYVLSSSGFQGASMGLRVPGTDTDQQCLIDTGSSTMAFCNASLAAYSKDVATPYAECNAYGNPVDDGKGCSNVFEYFYGSIYMGPVEVFDPFEQTSPLYTMKEVSYTIMDYQQNMTCDLNFDCIFGVAFDHLNKASMLPTGMEARDLLGVTCPASEKYGPLGSCVTPEGVNVSLVASPVLKALSTEFNADETSIPKTFGIYFDYMATKGLDAGMTPALGLFLAGEVARKNPFYQASAAQTTDAGVLNAQNGVKWYWDFVLEEISVDGDAGKALTYEEDYCGYDGFRCIQDTGTPMIELPIPQEVCDGTFTDKNDTSLMITIKGNSATAPVVLDIPIDWFLDEYNRGFASCSGVDGEIVLGFPILEFYYIVYDADHDTLTFLDLRKLAIADDDVRSNSSAAESNPPDDGPSFEQDVNNDDVGNSSATGSKQQDDGQSSGQDVGNDVGNSSSAAGLKKHAVWRIMVGVVFLGTLLF
jgi:hypothetical protein